MTLLLACDDMEVVLGVLRVLGVYGKKPFQPGRTSRWHADPGLRARLLALAQGWGGKEEGLGLLACATVPDWGHDPKAAEAGASLHFEFYDAEGTVRGSAPDAAAQEGAAIGSVGARGEAGGVPDSTGLRAIDLKDVTGMKENDFELLKKLVRDWGVPKKLRFSLLTRLRYARRFSSLEDRQRLTTVRLMALLVLLLCSPDPEEMNTFFANEPDLISELTALVCEEHRVPLRLRTVGFGTLAVLAQDRPRHGALLTALSSSALRTLLPSMVQKSIRALSSDVSGIGEQMAKGMALVSSQPEPMDTSGGMSPGDAQGGTEGGGVPAGGQRCGTPGGSSSSSSSSSPSQREQLAFMEALLAFLYSLAVSSSGCVALRDLGIFPTLLPLVSDTRPAHLHLCTTALHILEAFMDLSNSTAVSAFRESGGLGACALRLKTEVERVQEAAIAARASAGVPAGASAGASGGAGTAAAGGATLPVATGPRDRKGKAEVKEDSAAATAAPGSNTGSGTEAVTATPEPILSPMHKSVVKALLRVVSQTAYSSGAPAGAPGTQRLPLEVEADLLAAMRAIFSVSKDFGGGIFSLAANMLTDHLHQEPTSFATLEASGVPQAFLDSLAAGEWLHILAVALENLNA